MNLQKFGPQQVKRLLHYVFWKRSIAFEENHLFIFIQTRQDQDLRSWKELENYIHNQRCEDETWRFVSLQAQETSYRSSTKLIVRPVDLLIFKVSTLLVVIGWIAACSLRTTKTFEGALDIPIITMVVLVRIGPATITQVGYATDIRNHSFHRVTVKWFFKIAAIAIENRCLSDSCRGKNHDRRDNYRQG